jgi:hypothetical protein
MTLREVPSFGQQLPDLQLPQLYALLQERERDFFWHIVAAQMDRWTILRNNLVSHLSPTP